MTQKYTFSGHESFTCKTLWIKKGYDFAKKGMNFNSPEAVIALGVGKNMVASIRYWLKAFGIYANDQLTWLGNYLFEDNNGKDPYMEDIATLWLLHFNIVFSQEASLYNMFFCSFQKQYTTFDRAQIQTFVKLRMAEEGKQKLFNANTVKKDVNVLLQNYVPPRKAASGEDYSSLLIDLDLIRQRPDNDRWYFNVEGKRKVVKEIFLYALLRLKELEGDDTIPYDTIQDKIGLVFCMSDSETIAMLKMLANEYPQSISYNDVAGVRQVQFTSEMDYINVLNNYYEAL